MSSAHYDADHGNQQNKREKRTTPRVVKANRLGNNNKH